MQLDGGKYAGDTRAQAFSELLTPVAKAFLTDRGFECAVLAQQVLGGHGYLVEHGLEQIVRDVRIAQIYEGTNGIQAMDLMDRKVLRDRGKTLRALMSVLRADPGPSAYVELIDEAFGRLDRVTAALLERWADDENLAGSAAVEYLDLVGYTIFAWLWAKMAGAAPDDEFGAAKRFSAEFFMSRLLPRTLGLERSLLADSGSVMDTPIAAF